MTKKVPVLIHVDGDLLRKLDQYAEANKLSRSAAVRLMISEKLRSSEVVGLRHLEMQTLATEAQLPSLLDQGWKIVGQLDKYYLLDRQLTT